MKHLPKINLSVIPHKKHRYETVGDYYPKGKEWFFEVSKMNSDYEALVFLHEFVEFYLTQKRGIGERDITLFDEKFEDERSAGKWTTEEPGHDPRAPYRNEHIFAEQLERLFAQEMGIDWDRYSSDIDLL
jgi:hypothetical protein